jgi:hypothetical protein
MPGITKHDDQFQSLVQALSEKLGPCSGIDSADVDEKELQQLMEDYISDESEWSKYFFPASNMAYTRNLVDKGNGKSNLVCCPYTSCSTSELTLEADSGVVARARQPYSRVSFFIHRLLT